MTNYFINMVLYYFLHFVRFQVVITKRIHINKYFSEVGLGGILQVTIHFVLIDVSQTPNGII